MPPILVTGSTGNVGAAVVRALSASETEVRSAVRPGQRPASGSTVPFDFQEPVTWAPAFDGVRSMFLVRPPALGNVKRDLLPAVAAAREAGVRHVVLLSLQGAQRNKIVPHATVESWLRHSGLDWTFVRASFFHQNLTTTHVADIRDRDQVVVPAGRGATAFVDAEDVGAVAAAALLDAPAHTGRAWTVTGPRALTYAEIADILTVELGRPIRYTRPGILRYARHARRELDLPVGMVAVTSAIYTAARLGLAAGLSDDVRTVLGRAPVDFADFAHRERGAWERAVAPSTDSLTPRTSAQGRSA
ncbi:NmrA family NAD(P)-binding protein [Cellulomonas fimi]|uniref:NmrA family NAD(P)-binding protein n=1 Tax=Cellulomonas fimi TaxID=1708 RepID=A0A7Y0LXL5_CELFI|nr:NmrA family NAD(P)-binding protein [Cellulomonas fimi]NMR20111.1 NmrA family NAD(P)-binding protein [Cellulomonas fimi]